MAPVQGVWDMDRCAGGSRGQGPGYAIPEFHVGQEFHRLMIVVSILRYRWILPAALVIWPCGDSFVSLPRTSVLAIIHVLSATACHLRDLYRSTCYCLVTTPNPNPTGIIYIRHPGAIRFRRHVAPRRPTQNSTKARPCLCRFDTCHVL